MGLSEEMMSAAVTAADVVRGAGGDISLLQLKAFEYLGIGGGGVAAAGRSHISSSAHWRFDLGSILNAAGLGKWWKAVFS